MADAVDDTALTEAEVAQLIRLAEHLTPENVPHVLVSRGRELRYLESLTLHWGIWAHPSSPGGAATAAELRHRLTGTRRVLGGVSATDLVPA